jgi:hypothetical protein
VGDLTALLQRTLILVLVIAFVPFAASLAAPGITHPVCAGAQTPVLFAQWDTQLENLAFDGAGHLYVSDLGQDRLVRATPDGAVETLANVPGLHGITLGPDGLMYAGATVGSGPGVIRFTSLDPPVREDLASGLVAANGMTFDASGNLFVSNPGLGTRAPYLVRLPASDMGAWSTWGDEYGVNGLWFDGERILAAITADQSSPILSISTSDPEDVRVVAQLTLGSATLQPGAHAPAGGPGLVPKGLDDITMHEGLIYAAAHVSGEVMRIDPATGDACVLASGLEEPTSVRVAHGFGPWDGTLFVTDMGGAAVSALFGPGAGAIWAIPLL